MKRKGASSNDEADDEKDEDNRRRENVKVRGRDMPILIESLGTCYLAFILLRLPISVGDLQRYFDIHRGGGEAPCLADTYYSSMHNRWAIKERIPFVRATRFIPRVMTNRLPAGSINALETTYVCTRYIALLDKAMT